MFGPSDPSGIDARRAPQTPRRTARLAAYVIGLVIAALAVVASSLMFVWPSSSAPRPADAILVLNGADDAERARLGLSLLRRRFAPVMLFSEGAGGNDCIRSSTLDIVCFDPKPARTVGEIMYASRYASAHHLTSLLVVAGREQTFRARLLAARCFPGRVQVLPASTHWWEVPFQVIYEWGATIKAETVNSGCS